MPDLPASARREGGRAPDFPRYAHFAVALWRRLLPVARHGHGTALLLPGRLEEVARINRNAKGWCARLRGRRTEHLVPALVLQTYIEVTGGLATAGSTGGWSSQRADPRRLETRPAPL
ncbi:MAG: hypothetical protein GYB53_11940 [Rhodobacteraceae bacterium]|nr:hypothetical protein [Paracoccaceae bacterium]MBR9821412.1 hypothetical protein [Paracoccaceae bacterium]